MGQIRHTSSSGIVLRLLILVKMKADFFLVIMAPRLQTDAELSYQAVEPPVEWSWSHVGCFHRWRRRKHRRSCSELRPLLVSSWALYRTPVWPGALERISPLKEYKEKRRLYLNSPLFTKNDVTIGPIPGLTHSILFTVIHCNAEPFSTSLKIAHVQNPPCVYIYALHAFLHSFPVILFSFMRFVSDWK